MSNSQQWYMAIGGHQVGPVSAEEIVSNIRNGSMEPNTLVFTAGMTDWTPVSKVEAFAGYFRKPTQPVRIPAAPGRTAHEIDFRIFGEELQFVEVELDPGESAVAEAGGMMYMTEGVEMNTVFGDGSESSVSSGIMGKLLGAGKRLLTGESLFMTIYTNAGHNKQRVAFAAPYAGKIVPMDLTSLGGRLICQKDSFLCAARGVSISIAFQKKIGVGLFGGEGFIMQRLEGDGLCFIHAGGTIHALELAPGQKLRVDTGCLVALQPSVSYDIQFVGKVKTALFGGEGIFFASLTGPGKVWLQSLPLSRLADRIYKAIPSLGRGRKGEGSVLDAVGIGNLIDGD
ncbi:MAG: TIGR00266 family protein [Acidobacteria bacterium]|nr:TIGR00266 family protein [Acidobacteriota bacterium]